MARDAPSRDAEAPETDPASPGGDAGGPGRAARILQGAAAVLLFLVAIRFLGAASESLATTLERWVPQLLAGPGDALGGSWLLSYALLNGSVVAALALTLFSSGALGAPGLLLMVAGSRLGAAAFVVLVGALEGLRGRGRPALRRTLGPGLLTFLVTHSVYIPATVLAYLGLPWLQAIFLAGVEAAGLPGGPLPVTGGLADRVVADLGTGPAAAVAILLMLLSIHLFHRALRRKGAGPLPEPWSSRLRRPGFSFLLGLVVTLVTASVSFSVGVLVPLYSRRLVGREEAVPYILGASIGTVSDTVAVAVVLGSPLGTATLFALILPAILVTLTALVLFRPYFAMVDAAFEAILANRVRVLACGTSLVLVPVALILVA